MPIRSFVFTRLSQATVALVFCVRWTRPRPTRWSTIPGTARRTSVAPASWAMTTFAEPCDGLDEVKETAAPADEPRLNSADTSQTNR